MKILVTGVAGFIGMHLASRLLQAGHEVCGLDSMNNYYDTNLKIDRIKNIGTKDNFTFEKINLVEKDALNRLFLRFQPQVVVNLAAQAGVRYSIESPDTYIDSNIVGFANLLECCRQHKIKHLVYASSSSVYGSNRYMPFDEGQNVDHPIALYGATKKANELLAHSYSHLFGLPTTGVRFFTVYGPWGRPDMALFKFTEAILNNKEIKIYNHGKMARDFTYIDDVVEGIIRLLDKPAKENLDFNVFDPDAGTSNVPWHIFNIGNGQPVELMKFIEALEVEIGIKAKKSFIEMQPGDVLETSANTSRLETWTGFKPKTDVTEGVRQFVDWYKWYYKI